MQQVRGGACPLLPGGQAAPHVLMGTLQLSLQRLWRAAEELLRPKGCMPQRKRPNPPRHAHMAMASYP